MIYGFENNSFYLDVPSTTRPVGNLREETNRRALELSQQYDNLVLSNSSGVDSQVVLKAFIDQGLPIKSVFMHLPGYNDNEFQNIKDVDAFFNITTEIISVDLDSVKDELEAEAEATGIQVYSLLWKKFLSLIPSDWNLIQMTHDPYIHSTRKKNDFYYYISHNGPEITRERAFNLVERTGKVIYFGDTSEYLLSILKEDALVGCLYSLKYISNNGLVKPGVSLTTFDRWDYYVKPALYGQHWKNEIIYFSKYVGWEEAGWLKTHSNVWENGVYVPYFDLIEHLEAQDGSIKRYSLNALVGSE